MSKKVVKARDKWKSKLCFRVFSPKSFGFFEVGEFWSESADRLKKRVIEVPLDAITGDFSQSHIKLYFQVIDVEGDKAYTIFKGHDMTRDYLRSLIRRGCSRVEGVFNATTSDGYRVQVAILALTRRRSKTSQRKVIRRLMGEIVEDKSRRLDFNAFIQEAVLSKVASDIYNEAKKIYPLRKIEVTKSKLLEAPEKALTPPLTSLEAKSTSV